MTLLTFLKAFTVLQTQAFESLPNDEFLDRTKFKAFTDDIFMIAKEMISVIDRVENIVGKGENGSYQHFLFFLTMLLTNYHTMLHFDALKIYSCGKHCEKRRNCL